ncbi:MAG: sugar phosphate isomerase/epimerase family protein [Thermoproteota archaeon]|nr:sugar phosphate isomerase/epimerase [Candidatus Brockarchaeota archaeon]
MKLRLGTSTYSFWHFSEVKTPIEYVMEQAYNLELDGVEILEVQLESRDTSYLNSIKAKALELGLDIYCVATHQNFVSPSKEVREQEIEKTKKSLDLAYHLGSPIIRVNSGRWGTIKSFDELMKNKGIEPPIKGYSEEDAFGWVIESLNKLLPYAENYGIILGLENHWGLTINPEGLLKIIESINSKYLQVLMDTGNFTENIYESLRKIVKRAALVHAKTYFGGGVWYSLDIDYKEIYKILREVNYKGYISIEYEGKEEPTIGVKKSIDLIKNSFNPKNFG